MDILAAKKQGAKLIIVDPRRTESAAKADIYTTIRPGTDGALVLGMINVIIEKKLWDKDFVSRYTTGFERLRDFVGNYTPARVEEITWVERDLIEEVAATYATTKPACADRREGVIHHENGTQICRAINLLNVITGNIDIPGGIKLNLNWFDKSHPFFDKLTLRALSSSAVGSISGNNPITQDVPTDIPKAILEEKPYPIKALFVFGSNPLLAWPNTNVVLKALKKLDFLVVVDIYRNETAHFADFVLPAATFLEKTDLQAPDLAIPTVVQLQQKVIEPLHEGWSELKMIRALAQKMGFGEYFQDGEEDLLDKLLSPWGLSTDVLKQNGSGIVFDPKPMGYYRKNGFPTASGKIEIFSSELERAGFDPLPAFKEPSESPVSTPDVAKEFPLILASGNRIQSSYLSFLHNLPSLHAKVPRNWIEIHPKTAEDEGIREGEWVAVRSPRGSIQLEVRLNPRIDRRVVFIPYGWGHHFDGSWQLANADPGANVNFLTDDTNVDKISGMPNYKSLLCKIDKCT
jgi:anaerobic selenocysteine-containing dehydrogenase